MRSLLVIALCVACGKPPARPATACPHPCAATCCGSNEMCSEIRVQGQPIARCVRH